MRKRTHLWDSWGVSGSESSLERNLQWRRRKTARLDGAWQGFRGPHLLGSLRGSAELSRISSGLGRARWDLIRAGSARRVLAGLPGSSSDLVESWRSSEVSRNSLKVVEARENSLKVDEDRRGFVGGQSSSYLSSLPVSLSLVRWK